MTLLSVRDLTVRFGDKKVVDSVSLEVGRNEIVGLVGESGSGKTLTGYSILGITPKEAKVSGSIALEGKEILGLSDKKMLDIRGRRIGIVFQEPFTSLNPVLTIGYQIAEMIKIHEKAPSDQAKKKVLELLNKVKIKNPVKVISDYPHRLSGGERQRAMIAMAIALRPELLIADELTTALDVTIQSEILKLLIDLRKEMGLALLFISHDFGIINQMAEKVLVMKSGLIVERGKKEDILTHPGNEYTKKLISAVPRMSIDRRPQTIDHRLKTIDKKQGVFIEAANLSKSYPIENGMLRKEVSRFLAVKHVSIKIEKGKTLGLVGESGCGKSTLGKLLLGLEKPDSGDIIINGKNVTRYPKFIRKLLQIVFQDPFSSLDPKMRMEDIVLEGVSILGVKRDQRTSLLKEILDKTQLSYNDKNKYPHQFSGGERQRIAIARALAVNPEFIVLDEPVSSLDVIIQKGILELLKQIKKEMGLTYLFISHDLRVVESISDEICVMQNGEIVERGSTESIYRHPEHPYTKKLLSSIPSM